MHKKEKEALKRKQNADLLVENPSNIFGRTMNFLVICLTFIQAKCQVSSALSSIEDRTCPRFRRGMTFIVNKNLTFIVKVSSDIYRENSHNSL